jgi:putative oxidoreductase
MTDLGLLLMRLTFGGLMAIGHGWPKFTMLISHWREGTDLAFPDPLGIGVLASVIGAVVGELIAGLLVTLGFLTRYGALAIVATMFVAGFVHHHGDPWFLPAPGAREPALIYMLGALAIAIAGPGKISLDAVAFTKKRRF